MKVFINVGGASLCKKLTPSDINFNTPIKGMGSFGAYPGSTAAVTCPDTDKVHDLLTI